MASLGRTSCVDFISSVHGAQRRAEREISKRDLQTAVKYGVKEQTFPHPRTGDARLKFTYNNIVYITDSTATTEVTSWALVQFPILKAEIDESLSGQIAEQKRRLSCGATAVTSHAVLVVDQSGSMKNGDVVGHRSRSRGAYYTIANEMIAQPLLRDQISFTDVVTVIEMRDGAVVTIDKEPITWELHNKIVDLANEPLRARGQGNYLPALQKSSEVLHSIADENCALLLLFLSDGGPSDHDGLFRGVKNSHDLARAAILKEVRKICQRFVARLTFGTFGFAHDKELSCGMKIFDLLRSMAQVAEEAGSGAVFACGLDTDSLRRALFTMASSLQMTRTNLSSLAGGSLLRVTGSKVKRTDLKKDVSGSESDSVLLCDHDFHFTRENGLRRMVSRKNRLEREGILWMFVPLQHPGAGGIAVKKGYIEKGAERATYEMTEVTVDRVAVGQTLVGKLSIHEESSQLAFHQRCAVTQFEALRLAGKFNARLEELSHSDGISVPPIEFLTVSFYEWYAADGSVSTLLSEKRLDSTRYKKWNDNRGRVISLNKRKVPEEVGDEEEEEGTFAQEADPAPGSTADVPQAFSHWTYNYTQGESLVCDVQGVLGNSSFQLTDPSIHSSTRRYGSTDHGRNGQRNFFKTHECNPLCRALYLRPAAAAQPAVKGPSSSWLSRKVQKV
ncbi:kinase-like domain-containing protein [Ochromonadaceae sp. CCMP2298]|nr:kinase-like domain-containing protein [Ochromonadaceae sp. CCMP2298]